MPSHIHELEAVKLLTKLDINSEDIQHTIQKYDIDLDVADSLGNTRLMISSVIFYILYFNIYFHNFIGIGTYRPIITYIYVFKANDQHEVIKCLINLGADLECYNDIGFTPLNLTIMRYICLLNNINYWTEYLIPHVDLKFNIIKGKL